MYDLAYWKTFHYFFFKKEKEFFCVHVGLDSAGHEISNQASVPKLHLLLIRPVDYAAHYYTGSLNINMIIKTILVGVSLGASRIIKVFPIIFYSEVRLQALTMATC